jgi:hypothetical protein
MVAESDWVDSLAYPQSTAGSSTRHLRVNRHRIGLAALAACALSLGARSAAAQAPERPDTVGNFGVFHLPAVDPDDNHDMAIVASSDADRMSAVSWRCRGRGVVVEVLLDRSHGFTGTTAKLTYRFDAHPAESTLVRRRDPAAGSFAIPTTEVHGFSQRAMRASRLSIRAVASGGRAREYRFDLTGAAAALGSLPCVLAPRPRAAGVSATPK